MWVAVRFEGLIPVESVRGFWSKEMIPAWAKHTRWENYLIIKEGEPIPGGVIQQELSHRNTIRYRSKDVIVDFSPVINWERWCIHCNVKKDKDELRLFTESIPFGQGVPDEKMAQNIVDKAINLLATNYWTKEVYSIISGRIA